MDRRGREPAIAQLVGDLGSGALGTAEDDRQPPALGLEHPRQHLHLVHGVDTVDELLDGLDGVGVVAIALRHRPDVGRLGHVAPGQGDDGAGHGRREEHHLPRGRREGEEALDVGQEAEVEHLVGLVENDRLDPGQVEVTLLGKVDEAAGGAHDDLDAAPQRLDLRLVGPPAVDGEDPDAAAGAGLIEVARHLDRELAGRGDRQRLGLAGVRQVGPLVIGGRDGVVEDGDPEPEGLARPGLGLADDVVAVERHGQGHRLDGEGRGDSLVGQGGDDVGVDREVGEGGLGVGHKALVIGSGAS